MHTTNYNRKTLFIPTSVLHKILVYKTLRLSAQKVLKENKLTTPPIPHDHQINPNFSFSLVQLPKLETHVNSKFQRGELRKLSTQQELKRVREKTDVLADSPRRLYVPQLQEPLPVMPEPRVALTDADLLAEVKLTSCKTHHGSAAFLSPGTF